jgi:hypothetical protein
MSRVCVVHIIEARDGQSYVAGLSGKQWWSTPYHTSITHCVVRWNNSAAPRSYLGIQIGGQVIARV